MIPLQATKELLYKIADDSLIIGHRHSEWTGFGPILEEDIAFSSMAQDKIGHSLALYTLLETMGELPPDQVAFMRKASQFHNCILVELPNGEYDFSLMRHFLYDHATAIRFEALTYSTCKPLAQLALKIKSELVYHTLHADTWVKQLGTATEESITRMQKAINQIFPYAMGIFETSPYEETLITSEIFVGEFAIQNEWIKKINGILKETALTCPPWQHVKPILGGRRGCHDRVLHAMLKEMGEVVQSIPSALW